MLGTAHFAGFVAFFVGIGLYHKELRYIILISASTPRDTTTDKIVVLSNINFALQKNYKVTYYFLVIIEFQ